MLYANAPMNGHAHLDWMEEQLLTRQQEEKCHLVRMGRDDLASDSLFAFNPLLPLLDSHRVTRLSCVGNGAIKNGTRCGAQVPRDPTKARLTMPS